MDVPFDSPDVLLFTTGRFRNHFWFFLFGIWNLSFFLKYYLTISDRRLIAGNSRIDTYRVFIFYRVFWQFRTLLIELNRFPWHRSDWLVPSFVVNTTLILKISQYYLVFFWTNIYHREKKTRQRISLAKNRLFFVFREFKSCRKSSKWLTGFYLVYSVWCLFFFNHKKTVSFSDPHPFLCRPVFELETSLAFFFCCCSNRAPRPSDCFDGRVFFLIFFFLLLLLLSPPLVFFARRFVRSLFFF